MNRTVWNLWTAWILCMKKEFSITNTSIRYRCAIQSNYIDEQFGDDNIVHLQQFIQPLSHSVKLSDNKTQSRLSHIITLPVLLWQLGVHHRWGWVTSEPPFWKRIPRLLSRTWVYRKPVFSSQKFRYLSVVPSHTVLILNFNRVNHFEMADRERAKHLI